MSVKVLHSVSTWPGTLKTVTVRGNITMRWPPWVFFLLNLTQPPVSKRREVCGKKHFLQVWNCGCFRGVLFTFQWRNSQQWPIRSHKWSSKPPAALLNKTAAVHLHLIGTEMWIFVSWNITMGFKSSLKRCQWLMFRKTSFSRQIQR